jgi:VanW like protein
VGNRANPFTLSHFGNRISKLSSRKLLVSLLMSSPARARISGTAEATVPSRWGAFLFVIKATLLQAHRGVMNLLTVVPRHVADAKAAFGMQIAAVRTLLWTTESMVERSLQLGKVQNLRVAARALHGVVVPAGQTFSFWRQLGRTTRAKGYVPGRELREGCLIPAIGGGICQLSNALYDAALQSGCEIVERHAHSRVVPGSAAELGRDATVAWNYVDLRFRPRQGLRIHVQLSGQALTVRFLAALPVSIKVIAAARAETLPRPLDPIAHTCTDCGVNACFRHIEPETSSAGNKRAYLLDECWPEFLTYIERQATIEDFIAAPAAFGRYRGVGELRAKARSLHSTWRPAFWRAIRMRSAQNVPSRLQAQLMGSEQIAETMAAAVPFEASHVVTAQSLLPFLWNSGALGGRTFDVFMTRMPLAHLHRLLDEASAQNPQLATLREYRAPQWMTDAEQEALASARRIISPHVAIAELFGERALQLPWHLPKVSSGRRGRAVVFPGPTVARKGALVLRAAMVSSNRDLMILAGNLEQADFWQGVQVAPLAQNWLENAALVVQPALLEDNPRALLRALAAGIPVICTRNCGLGDLPNVTTVEFGNVEQLRRAISSTLQNADD